MCCKWHHRPTTVTPPPPAPKHTGQAQGPLKTATRCRLNKAQGRTGSSGSSHPLDSREAENVVPLAKAVMLRAKLPTHCKQMFSSLRPIADASESGVTRLRNRDLGPFAVTYCPFRLPGGPAPPCNRQRPFFCVRLRAGECGTRHSGAAGLAWPPQYSAYSSLYRARPGQVPRFLALVTPPSPARRRRTTSEIEQSAEPFVGRPRAGESTQCTILR